MTDKTKSVLFALITILLWSSAFPLTKVATAYIAPNALGFLRCSIAALILIVIGIINKIKLPRKPIHMLLFFISGGLGFTLYMITFNTGMLTLSSAMASLVIATTPVLTAIGASIIYKERIKPLGWACIATAFLGVAILLLWGSHLSLSSGCIWILCASSVFCGYNLMNRKLLSMGYNSVECVTWSILCGALLLLPFAPAAAAQAAEATWEALLTVVYLGAMPSAAAYLFWSRAFSIAKKTSDVTNFQFLTPLVSTVLGFIILGEIPGVSTLVGGVIIISSIVLFGLKGR